MVIPPNQTESRNPALPRRGPRLSPSGSERGSALLISLTMIVLITVVILAFVVQTNLERQLSATNWDDQQAQNIAQVGFDSALSLIRETLSPYDDPFGATNMPVTFWSLSPGRIDQFLLTNGHARPLRLPPVELHSGYPAADLNDPADLNKPDGFGHGPIWRAGPPMPVGWRLVGQNPAEAVSSTNVMVGRFAFWVDDEGSKINVNTADGTDNYMLSGYGQGTPTAVSLSVFAELGGTNNAPDENTVRLVAAEARRQPFAAISEIATRTSLTNAVNPNFPATNAFNLTTYSRSPDFNLFNQPRFQLIPSNVDSLTYLAGTNISGVPFLPINRTIQYAKQGTLTPWPPTFSFYEVNGTGSMSALRSLYPGANQLSSAWRTQFYPLMPNYPMLDGGVQLVTSSQKMAAAGGNFWANQTARFAAMLQMARYLVGTNAFGQPIQWPFEDANYHEKYNLRQIDSIMLQFFEMPRNAAMRFYHPGYGDERFNNDYLINPSILPYGLLGTKPVGSAVGRYPRLTRVLAKVDLYPRVEAFPRLDSNVFYPGIQTNALGGIPGTGYDDGANFRMNLAFSQYVPRHLYDSDNLVDGQWIDRGGWDFGWASPFGWGGNGGMNEMDGDADMISALNPSSRWMDTLMSAEAWNSTLGYFDSGIDFRANPSSYPDPDPRAGGTNGTNGMRRLDYRANVPRRSYDTNGNGITTYVTAATNWGTGWNPDRTAPMLRFVPFGPYPSYVGPSPGISQNFSQNFSGGGTLDTRGGSLNQNFRTRNWPEEMAFVEKIRLRGGITLQVRSQSRMGLTPVDAIRGPLSASSTWASRVVTNSSEVTANLINAVVPIFTSKGQPLEVELGKPPKYIVAKLRDPLVGQLPGDWVVNHYTNLPGTNQTRLSGVFVKDTDGASANNISWPQNQDTGNAAPFATQFDSEHEPEWVDMAADSGAVALMGAHGSNNVIFRPYKAANGVQRIQVGSGFTDGAYVNLARQKTFPSVGHLQYVRTGAMPDNEEAKIGEAEYAGMPFRCLNFGPENTQGGIPDWAMLDLFMVPNAIWTLPSSRFAYPAISAGQTNRPELINLTYGGASSGKINLNGAVLWPWAKDDTNFVRPLPLAAQFNNLRYNTNGVVNRTANKLRVTTTKSWEVLLAPEAKTLAEAVAAYIRVNEPLALSGQLCDIPAVNAYGAEIPTRKTINGVDTDLLPPNAEFYGSGNPSPDGFNRTRNDIVSQSLGNFTVQGNVFAVWVMGESIRKSSSSDPATFERDKGDRVVAQFRVRFLVERKLDPGSDGVYGNSAPGGAGIDGVIGTPDDLLNASSHPANPKFVYQVINVQKVQ